jgi:hypothetical protein
MVSPSSRRALRLDDFHVGERLMRLVGRGDEQLVGDPGLHVDQREVVADAVVQLAGDAQALVGDAAAGVPVAFVLGLQRAGLDFGEVGAPVA